MLQLALHPMLCAAHGHRARQDGGQAVVHRPGRQRARRRCRGGGRGGQDALVTGGPLPCALVLCSVPRQLPCLPGCRLCVPGNLLPSCPCPPTPLHRHVRQRQADAAGGRGDQQEPAGAQGVHPRAGCRCQVGRACRQAVGGAGAGRRQGGLAGRVHVRMALTRLAVAHAQWRIPALARLQAHPLPRQQAHGGAARQLHRCVWWHHECGTREA